MVGLLARGSISRSWKALRRARSSCVRGECSKFIALTAPVWGRREGDGGGSLGSPTPPPSACYFASSSGLLNCLPRPFPTLGRNLCVLSPPGWPFPGVGSFFPPSWAPPLRAAAPPHRRCGITYPPRRPLSPLPSIPLPFPRNPFAPFLSSPLPPPPSPGVSIYSLFFFFLGGVGFPLRPSLHLLHLLPSLPLLP